MERHCPFKGGMSVDGKYVQQFKKGALEMILLSLIARGETYGYELITALNDGAVSAAISFMRALVLPVICIIVMPMLWKLDGVWYSLVASEILGVFVSLYFLLGNRKKYQY